LPFLAASRISLPMCSPSRSQSVQMKRASARLAWSSIFLAMFFLSCLPFQCPVQRQVRSRRDDATHIWDNRLHRGVEKTVGRRVIPALILWWELHSSKVPLDSRHSHRTSPPGRTEVKVKHIIFYVHISGIVLVGYISFVTLVSLLATSLPFGKCHLINGLRLLSRWKAFPLHRGYASYWPTAYGVAVANAENATRGGFVHWPHIEFIPRFVDVVVVFEVARRAILACFSFFLFTSSQHRPFPLAEFTAGGPSPAHLACYAFKRKRKREKRLFSVLRCRQCSICIFLI
jgi:hypothetical protein